MGYKYTQKQSEVIKTLQCLRNYVTIKEIKFFRDFLYLKLCYVSRICENVGKWLFVKKVLWLWTLSHQCIRRRVVCQGKGNPDRILSNIVNNKEIRQKQKAGLNRYVSALQTQYSFSKVTVCVSPVVGLPF